MWTLTQLRYFNILTQTLNYREAAERLDISEPALSMQIRKLESVLGTKLFHRQGRAIALTTAGRQFTFHAIQILQAVDDANRSVTARTPRQTLRLGASGNHLFSPIIGRIADACPQLTIQMSELTTTDIIDQVKNHTLDAGIAFLPVDDPAISSHYLFSDRLMAITAPDNNALQKATLANLSRVPLAVLADRFYVRRILDDAFQAQSLVPHYQLALGSYHSIATVVQHSHAVGLVSAAFLRSQDPHRWRILPLADTLTPLPMGFIYPRGTALDPVLQQTYQAVAAFHHD
ncbi:LysR family transcriptional regulator [Schleiferilactobacillus harbinensis]|uniref:LysR family transcriptional regulator n=1 Tax=Schleiferilactobacillus harbinensis TaxID=304207 RepID=UPI00123BE1B6|nr:LysR family transcriptional regulator [Schleiferilactobacillus harbinensis]QEU47562.1 LysR family transcriptional regulator [Schleiferilactobacillus harbinensis]